MSDISDDKLPPSPTVAAVAAEPHLVTKERELDAAAAYASDRTYTPEENKRLLRKIDLHLMPMMMFLYLIQFWDKTTLGSSVLLGVKTDNHLSQSQFNWLSTIFYLSYLIFEWPQNLGLQRYPVGKWMAGNIMFWAAFLALHAVCSSFARLFIVRFLLGICEGSITAGFMIVTSQARPAQSLRLPQTSRLTLLRWLYSSTPRSSKASVSHTGTWLPLLSASPRWALG